MSKRLAVICAVFLIGILLSFKAKQTTYQSDFRPYSVAFDLHGCDCGAPDCYETKYSFKWDHQNEAPELLQITVSETGCIESLTKSDDFEKVESATCWSYYSAKLGMNLVIEWNEEIICEAYCVMGEEVRHWHEISDFLDASCNENSEIDVFRLSCNG
ncbi:MAG: hypothetical protein ACI8ZM_002908 [Crocinitomix sp.]|jgi:hypothetical protein